MHSGFAALHSFESTSLADFTKLTVAFCVHDSNCFFFCDIAIIEDEARLYNENENRNIKMYVLLTSSGITRLTLFGALI